MRLYYNWPQLLSLLAQLVLALAIKAHQHSRNTVLVSSTGQSLQMASELVAVELPPVFPTPRALLPHKLVIGYCSWEQCDDQIVEAVKNGVNVVIWFSVNLVRDSATGMPIVQGGPNLDCVAEIVGKIRALDNPDSHQVVHLMSIGGWNSPHPTWRIEEMDELDRWNREVVARPAVGWEGFDGFDIDLEGNDDLASPYNTFSKNCLDFVGLLAQHCKRKGYVFGMAPAESYLDPFSVEFSTKLNYDYPEWRNLQPAFTYHGRNVYAYLLSKYGATKIGDAVDVKTFDFVTIQLYEGYSHAEHALNVVKENVSTYLQKLVSSLVAGWEVKFSQEPELDYPDSRVSVEPSQLVIGLANGWAGDGKFLLIDEADLERSYKDFSPKHSVRGYAFWCIKHEGDASVRDPSKPIFMAKILSKILS